MSTSPRISVPPGNSQARLRLLNMKDVAERLDVSLPRVYELARCGVLPVVRLGRQLRVEEGRLVAWINDGGRGLPGGWRRDLDWTPKMRHEVKGRPTLNGEVYGFGPENLQPRFEDRGDAGN